MCEGWHEGRSLQDILADALSPVSRIQRQLFLFEEIHFLFVRVWISTVRSVRLESPEQVWFIQPTRIKTPVFSVGGSVSSDLSAAI